MEFVSDYSDDEVGGGTSLLSCAYAFWQGSDMEDIGDWGADDDEEDGEEPAGESDVDAAEPAKKTKRHRPADDAGGSLTAGVVYAWR